MKLKNILGLLFIVSAFSVAASAQAPSLANVGDDIYTSEDDGFEIALPDGCVKVSASENGRNYLCDLKEGRVVVMIQNSDPIIKNDTDLKNYLVGFKRGLQKDASVSIVNEIPSKIGEYSGMTYMMTIDGDKSLMVALAWQKFTVTILGRAYSKVPNSAELISAAVQSFAFVSDN